VMAVKRFAGFAIGIKGAPAIIAVDRERKLRNANSANEEPAPVIRRC